VPPVCGLVRVAGSIVGSGEGVHHAGPLARKLTGQPTGTRAVAAGCTGALSWGAGSRSRQADLGWREMAGVAGPA
jgi:hypothetical protein